jgi:predicted restriction endonuclease
VPDNVAAELERRLFSILSADPPINSEEADDPNICLDNLADDRQRAIRAILIRRGQPAFRRALLEAYGGRCVITGCAIEDVLEAAHIAPYRGSLTNHVSNGLLLRADLHTLFDCGLLSVEPTSRTVVIGDALKASSYVKIAGKRIRPPNNSAHGPCRRHLEKNHTMFKALQMGLVKEQMDD